MQCIRRSDRLDQRGISYTPSLNPQVTAKPDSGQGIKSVMKSGNSFKLVYSWRVVCPSFSRVVETLDSCLLFLHP